MPRPSVAPAGTIERCEPWVRDGYVSVQVNVDADGCNILGDAANEPSIAINPMDPNNIVIGWRQFDTIESSFRQAGWAYSHDRGTTWTFPGVLEPGVFRSDPVLDADADGNFYYLSIRCDSTGCGDVFKSIDGGVSWLDAVPTFAGDKPWMAIDRTKGFGRGNVYCAWSASNGFARSTDGGAEFQVYPGATGWSSITVGPDGEVYTVLGRSDNAQNPLATPTFEPLGPVDLGGVVGFDIGSPNPDGLAGQLWIATAHSPTTTRGNVYLLASRNPRDGSDPLDVMFSSSTDRGVTWSTPVRVNDDQLGNKAWQWFGTMSVSPHGRIDVVFNDTRNSGVANMSELFYTYSHDAGRTWAPNVPVSPMFDSHVGWPRQRKLGDYYDMISDDHGVNIAYAATFNGEQDVYFLRLEPDCNDNGITDADEVLGGTSPDCDVNFNPDECDQDFDADGMINGCDSDMDDDGVLNDVDVCPFTQIGVAVQSDGSPISDTNGNCVVDLFDYHRFHNCLLISGPGQTAPLETCSEPFGYDHDKDIDLIDFAGFSAGFAGLP